MSTILFLLGTATIPFFLLYFPGTNQTIPNLLFFLACVVAVFEWWFYKGNLYKIRIPYHPFWLPSFLLLAGGLLATLTNSLNPGESFTVTLKQWFVFSIWMAVAVDITRRGHGGKILGLLILGAILTSLIALWSFITGQDLSYLFISANHPVVNVFGYGTSSPNLRIAGTFGHPNEQAFFLALIIPIILDRWLGRVKDWKPRDVIWAIIFLLVGTAVILTGSFSGYIGVFIACAIVVVVRFVNFGFSRKVLVTLIACGGALLFVVLIILFTQLGNEEPTIIGSVTSLAERGTLERVLGQSGPARVETYSKALDTILTSPLNGVGLDMESSNIPVNDFVNLQVHNTILLLWFSSGLLGLIGILIIYWKTFFMAINGIRDTIHVPRPPDQLGLAAAVIGFLVMDMTQPGIYQRQKWLIVALLYGGLLARRKIQKGLRIQPDSSLMNSSSYALEKEGQ